MESLPAVSADDVSSSGDPSPAENAIFAPKPRTCPECGGDFFAPAKGPGQHKRFCDAKGKGVCRQAFANREKAEGAVVVTVAKAWRKTRGGGELGKAAFAEMCSILDILNDSDARNGRPSISQKGAGPLRPYLDEVLSEPYMDRRCKR